MGTARQGCTVIVPFREEMAKRHLKVSGDLGRVIFMVGEMQLVEEEVLILDYRNMTYETHNPWRKAFDTRMLSTILWAGRTQPSRSRRRSVKGQHLTGYRNFDLEDVNVEGAERIAEAVAKYDVDRFIHVSSYNADVSSSSEFFSTKVGITFQ